MVIIVVRQTGQPIICQFQFLGSYTMDNCRNNIGVINHKVKLFNLPLQH